MDEHSVWLGMTSARTTQRESWWPLSVRLLFLISRSPTHLRLPCRLYPWAPGGATSDLITNQNRVQVCSTHLFSYRCLRHQKGADAIPADNRVLWSTRRI